MKIILISLVIVFAFIGIIMTSIFFHEVYHSIDYKPVNYTHGEICVIEVTNLTYGMGYFKFDVPANNSKIYHSISKYAEIKATLISFIVISIGFISIIFFWFSMLSNTFLGEQLA